jgi:glycosyltransferase involved in cell wall biosynthesis
MHGISVIICCYNSEHRLPQTINHLIAQSFNGFRVEIILVDNASTDNTSIVAFDLLKSQSKISYKIVKEPIPGLSNARKKGIDSSSYDVLLFCDDDNWLNPSYLATTYNLLIKHEDIMLLGGIGEPVFEKEKPIWFDEFQLNFACGKLTTNETNELEYGSFVYGAGMSIRKAFFEQLEKINFSSVLSDRKGNELSSGGDTEYCIVANMLGYKIANSNKLTFKHFMSDGRMNFNYLKQLHRGFGKTRVYTQLYNDVISNSEISGKNLKLPFWKDKLIHKKRELYKMYPKILFAFLFKNSRDIILKFEAQKGEVEERNKLKADITNVYTLVYTLKKNIERL